MYTLQLLQILYVDAGGMAITESMRPLTDLCVAAVPWVEIYLAIYLLLSLLRDELLIEQLYTLRFKARRLEKGEEYESVQRDFNEKKADTVRASLEARSKVAELPPLPSS